MLKFGGIKVVSKATYSGIDSATANILWTGFGNFLSCRTVIISGTVILSGCCACHNSKLLQNTCLYNAIYAFRELSIGSLETSRMMRVDLLKDKQALQRLTEAAEKAKMELSSLTQTNMRFFILSTNILKACFFFCLLCSNFLFVPSACLLLQLL